jgi:hypothetical protein
MEGGQAECWFLTEAAVSKPDSYPSRSAALGAATIVPILLGTAFSRSTLTKLMAIIVVGGLCVAAFYSVLLDKVFKLFFLTPSGSQISFEDASNGRAALRQYHLECFERFPIWGNGAFTLEYHRERESLGFLKAKCEIGLLSERRMYDALATAVSRFLRT